jgi:hypothetical protein
MCEKKPYCSRSIDPCLQEVIDTINKDPNLTTLSSCCGHTKYEATIVVLHKPTNIAYEHFSGVYLGPGKRPMNRYYKKDGKAKRDHYYIPEVVNQLPTVVIVEPASIRTK